MRLIEVFLEIIGWLQIALGVTLMAGLIALGIYLTWSNDTGRVIAIVVVSIGFIFGSFWATRIWIRHGTVAWLSRIRRIS